MAANIAVKDRATAEAWVAKAEALNTRANEANRQVATLLRQLDEGAAGEIVLKLVQFGNQVLSFAEQIFDGISQICSAITGLINLLEETIGGVVGVVKNIVSFLS